MMASGVVTSDEVEACAGVDVGGTFTDVVLHAPGRRPKAVKVPTTPDDPAEGVRRGVREACPEFREFERASTRALNAAITGTCPSWCPACPSQ